MSFSIASGFDRGSHEVSLFVQVNWKRSQHQIRVLGRVFESPVLVVFSRPRTIRMPVYTDSTIIPAEISRPPLPSILCSWLANHLPTAPHLTFPPLEPNEAWAYSAPASNSFLSRDQGRKDDLVSWLGSTNRAWSRGQGILNGVKEGVSPADKMLSLGGWGIQFFARMSCSKLGCATAWSFWQPRTLLERTTGISGLVKNSSLGGLVQLTRAKRTKESALCAWRVDNSASPES